MSESTSASDRSSRPYTSPTLSSKSSPSSLEQIPEVQSSGSTDDETRRVKGEGGGEDEKFAGTSSSLGNHEYGERSYDERSIDVAALLLASRRARSLHRQGMADGVAAPSRQDHNEGKIRSQSQRAEEGDAVNMGTTDKFTSINNIDRGSDVENRKASWTPSITSPMGSEGSQRKSRTQILQSGSQLNRSILDSSVQTQTMRSMSHSSVDLSFELQELADLTVQ